MSMAFFGNAEQQAQIRGMVLQYISEQSGLDVAEEYAIIEKFLLSYADSPETFKSYRREVERFLQWCYLEQKCLMAAVDRTLFADYLQYAFSPPAEVIAQKVSSRFIQKADQLVMNPSWRPYVYKTPKNMPGESNNVSPYIMNNSAKKALFAGLSTFYTYLQQEDYIAKNPVVLLRQKNRMIARAQTQHVTRRLSDIQWQFMIQTIQQYADQHSKYERHLFLLSAFYLLGVRIGLQI